MEVAMLLASVAAVVCMNTQCVQRRVNFIFVSFCNFMKWLGFFHGLVVFSFALITAHACTVSWLVLFWWNRFLLSVHANHDAVDNINKASQTADTNNTNIRKKPPPLLPLVTHMYVHTCTHACAHTKVLIHTCTHTHTHTDECVFDCGLLCFQMCGTSTYHTCILSFLSSVFYFYSVSITFLSLVFYFYSISITFLSLVFYFDFVSHFFDQRFTFNQYHISLISVLLLLSITFLWSVFYFCSVSHFFHQCFTRYHTACLFLLLFFFWSCVCAVLRFLSVYVSTNHLCVRPYSTRQKPGCRKCGQRVRCKHSSFHKVDVSVSP